MQKVVHPSSRLTPAVALLALLAPALACRDDSGPDVTIQIDAPVTTLASGDTLRLHAIVRDRGGAEVLGAEVHWTSSDTAVIAIDDAGLATGGFIRAPTTVIVTATTTHNVSASIPVVFKPCIQCGTWTQQPGLSVPRWTGAIVTVDGKVYAVGGSVAGGAMGFPSAIVEMFDPATNAWSRRASLPDGRQNIVAVALGGRVYVFGGQTPLGGGIDNVVRLYDPQSDAWTDLSPMPRVEFAGGTPPVAVGAKIYAFAKVSPAVVGIYDPPTNTWALGATTSKIPGPPVVLDGKIYFFGGDAGLAYDPATDTWTPRASMPSGRSDAATAVVHGKLYALGGHGASVACGEFLCQGPRSNLVEIFDPSTNTWASGKAIPISSQITLTDTIGGKILLGVYGENFAQADNVMQVYDPERNQWALRGSMPLADLGLGPTPMRTLSINGSVIAIFADFRQGKSAVLRFTP